MGEEEGCGNRKCDVASLGRNLKLHLLVYIVDYRLYLHIDAYAQNHDYLSIIM
jgi:hypothetical protein